MLEHTLYRAFNVSESIYQESPLSWLYRAPDWEAPPVYTSKRMTAVERIEHDSQILINLRRALPRTYFSILETIYCRSLCVEDWRSNLKCITPLIRDRIKPILFTRKAYEYTCISHLTGVRIKKLYLNSPAIRRNKKKVCSALDDISNHAHKMANEVLGD